MLRKLLAARAKETAFEMSDDRSAPMSEKECRMAETIDGMKHVLCTAINSDQHRLEVYGKEPIY